MLDEGAFAVTSGWRTSSPPWAAPSGRQSADEITLFKPVGVAVADVVAAGCCLKNFHAFRFPLSRRFSASGSAADFRCS